MALQTIGSTWMSAESSGGLPDLRSRVLGGMMWVGASQAGLQLTRAVVAIAVARLLTPEEYGLAALALVFASLVLVFSDLALGAALIQRKDLSRHDRDTAFWITIGSGVLFTLIGVALSGPIAALYGEPSAQPLLAVLSLSFLVSAAGAPQQSLMLREMDWRRVEMLPMFGAVAGGIGGVALAAAGVGAWAIIAQYLIATAITTALVWWRSPWRPGFAFSRESARSLAGFSIYMLGHRLLYYFQTNGDRFLIGRVLGTAALGSYAVAYNAVIQPASKIGGPLQRIFSPTFCRIQDEPERIAAAWARVVRLLASISVPALAGLVVVAPDFVPVVLGEQWKPAIPVIQILAWVGIVQALQSLSVDVLMARGWTRTIFRFSLVLTTCHLIAFAVGLQWGIIGVAAMYAVSTTLIEPAQSVLAARALGVSPMVFFRSLTGVFQAALGMCAVVLAVRLGLMDAGVGPTVRLVVCTAAGLVAYVGLCAWRVPELANEVRDLVRRRRAGRSTRLAPQAATVEP
jgi:O-antigen/teichoic acid export membrane protein